MFIQGGGKVFVPLQNSDQRKSHQMPDGRVSIVPFEGENAP